MCVCQYQLSNTEKIFFLILKFSILILNILSLDEWNVLKGIERNILHTFLSFYLGTLLTATHNFKMFITINLQ